MGSPSEFSIQMVDTLRRRVVELAGGRVVRDQARASYRDDGALIPAEVERRLALAAVASSARLVPSALMRAGRRH